MLKKVRIINFIYKYNNKGVVNIKRKKIKCPVLSVRYVHTSHMYEHHDRRTYTINIIKGNNTGQANSNTRDKESSLSAR